MQNPRIIEWSHALHVREEFSIQKSILGTSRNWHETLNDSVTNETYFELVLADLSNH
jgi:hypothetical protein